MTFNLVSHWFIGSYHNQSSAAMLTFDSLEASSWMPLTSPASVGDGNPTLEIIMLVLVRITPQPGSLHAAHCICINSCACMFARKSHFSNECDTQIHKYVYREDVINIQLKQSLSTYTHYTLHYMWEVNMNHMNQTHRE